MSLDGYIAGPGGDMSWLRPYLQPNPPIERLQQEIGALLVGGRTHRGDDPHRGTDREGAFEGTWDGPVFVVTRQPSTDVGPHVTNVWHRVVREAEQRRAQGPGGRD